MMQKLAKLTLLFAFAAGAQIAHAFVDPPVLVPPNPVAGQTVSIGIRAGVCDGFGGAPPAITRTGNNIRIVLQSISSFPPFCNYPTYTSTFMVGAFDAGNYSLQVDRDYLGDIGYVTQTLGILPFAVTGLATTPMLGLLGTITLALALLVVAHASASIRCSSPANADFLVGDR